MLAANEMRADIDELKFLLSQSKRAGVRMMLEAELTKANCTLSKLNVPAVRTEKKITTKSSCPTKKVNNYAWDETQKFVKVYITGIKEATDELLQENIECNFQEKSFNLMLRSVKGCNYTLVVLNLNSLIVPAECVVKVTKTGVTISMKKATAGLWGDLKKKTEDMSKKEDMPKMEKDGDPNDGLMKLMKQMYDSGDDEMKQQIAKTMYESQNKKNANMLPDMGDMNTGLTGAGMGGMPDMSGMGMPGMGMPGMGMPGMGDLGL